METGQLEEGEVGTLKISAAQFCCVHWKCGYCGKELRVEGLESGEIEAAKFKLNDARLVHLHKHWHEAMK